MRLRLPPLSLARLRERLQTDEYLPRRQLELPFLASLAVLAMLVIGAYVVEQRGASTRAADARVLNTAAGQATQTQRIAFLTSRLATTTSPAPRRRDRAALRNAARTMAGDDLILSAAA